MLRGEVSAGTAALEARSTRQRGAASTSRAETTGAAQSAASEADDQIHAPVARATPRTFSHPLISKVFSWLCRHHQNAPLQNELFQHETDQLLVVAKRIADVHCWSLLGFGEKCFGSAEINWNRDPLSGFDWPLDYHADINLFRGDGSDARVLWEVNRLSHLITLGRAYVVSRDEKLAGEFLKQVRIGDSRIPSGAARIGVAQWKLHCAR